MMQTWLVTGASGFLGSNIGHFLHGKVETVGTFRQLPKAGESRFNNCVELDLTDLHAINDRIRDLKPDVIVHAAAVSGHEACANHPEAARLVNVGATGHLANLAGEMGAKFVYVSTDAVFDGARGNYKESDVTNPFSLYGQLKTEGENETLKNPNSLIIRTNFFGWSPSGQASILEFFRNSLRSGFKIDGYTDFIVSSLYVQHLIQGMWMLRDTSGIVHVAAADSLSKYEFGLQVAEIFGLDAALITPQSAGLGTLGTDRRRNLSLSVERYSQLIGDLPTQRCGIDQALRDERSIFG